MSFKELAVVVVLVVALIVARSTQPPTPAPQPQRSGFIAKVIKWAALFWLVSEEPDEESHEPAKIESHALLASPREDLSHGTDW